MDNKLKTILAGIAGIAVIAGGLVVGLAEPAPLTWDELNALNEVYNYEIQKLGGTIDLRNVTQDNFLDVLNAEIVKRDVKEESVEIAGETLTPAEYLILRGGLIEKYEQKSWIDEIINP